ncbi:MAG: hypothetical protein IJX88_05005 [Clostridia bacterium]|nr:hypothetical protein [Clostridia bacterium]
MKKILKNTALALSALLLAFSAVSCEEKAPEADAVLFVDGMEYVLSEKGTPKEYSTLSYDIIGGDSVMPIGGFAVNKVSGGSENGNAKVNFISDEYMELIHNMGVNVFSYSTDFYEHKPSQMRQLLRLCEDYGIGMYVSSSSLAAMIGTRTTGTEIVEMDKELLYNKVMEFSENLTLESFIGLWIWDEPFPHWQMKNVYTMAKALKELNLPGVTSYCNICGYWEGESTFWNTCAPTVFETYAKDYMQIDVPMLSATQYPYTTNWRTLNAEQQESSIKSQLFGELSIYRAMSNECGKPLWRMLQAGGDFGSDKKGETYFPNEGEMLWDVNCSLAFGVKGIQYYTLCGYEGDCRTSDGGYDTYRSGIVGPDGNINEWYYYAQKANRQIKAIDHVLMHSYNEGVLVHGDKATELVGDPLKGTMYEGEQVLIKDSFRQLKSVSGDDAIIGCFDYQGGTALYVVNGSRLEKSDITLSFDNKYCYDVTQRTVTTSIVGKTFTLTLEAGEGALVVLR